MFAQAAKRDIRPRPTSRTGSRACSAGRSDSRTALRADIVKIREELGLPLEKHPDRRNLKRSRTGNYRTTFIPSFGCRLRQFAPESRWTAPVRVREQIAYWRGTAGKSKTQTHRPQRDAKEWARLRSTKRGYSRLAGRRETSPPTGSSLLKVTLALRHWPIGIAGLWHEDGIVEAGTASRRRTTSGTLRSRPAPFRDELF